MHSSKENPHYVKSDLPRMESTGERKKREEGERWAGGFSQSLERAGLDGVIFQQKDRNVRLLQGSSANETIMSALQDAMQMRVGGIELFSRKESSGPDAEFIYNGKMEEGKGPLEAIQLLMQGEKMQTFVREVYRQQADARSFEDKKRKEENDKIAQDRAELGSLFDA